MTTHRQTAKVLTSRWLRLTVLGAAGSHVLNPGREPGSGYLVQGESAVLLDCGLGVGASLSEHAPDARLDAVVVSHRHGDHTGGLAELLAGDCWRERPTVIGPAEVLALVDHVPREARYAVGDGDTLEIGDLTLSFSSTDHQVVTLACRVASDVGSLVYSADTGPRWRPPGSWQGCDLALVECTLAERDSADPPHHLDAREAAALARVLRSSETLLTHVPAGEDVDVRLALARAAWPAGCFAGAEPGLVRTVPPRAT